MFDDARSLRKEEFQKLKKHFLKEPDTISHTDIECLCETIEELFDELEAIEQAFLTTHQENKILKKSIHRT